LLFNKPRDADGRVEVEYEFDPDPDDQLKAAVVRRVMGEMTAEHGGPLDFDDIRVDERLQARVEQVVGDEARHGLERFLREQRQAAHDE
jgi:hypothetical protein